MENLYLYKVNEQYSKYMYEKNKKVIKSFEEKRKRPFVRNCIRNK